MTYGTPEGRQMVIRWLEAKLQFLQEHDMLKMSFTQTDIADILEALRGDDE